MSREGRSQPIQPYAAHGPIDERLEDQPNLLVVPLTDDRRYRQPLAPTVISGATLAAIPAPPPEPGFVDADNRRRRPAGDVVHASGSLVPTQTVAAVQPPPPVVVPVAERRRATPDPTGAPSGQLAATVPAAPAANPPAPLVVPAPERRRPTPDPTWAPSGLLAANAQAAPTAPPPAPLVVEPTGRPRAIQGGGEISSGYPAPDATPPAPVNLDRPEQRNRYRPPDPIVISGILAAPAPQVIPPPAPFVVPLEERRRFLAALPPEVRRGYDVAPPATPPPPAPFVVPPQERRRDQGGGEISAGYPDITTVPPPGPFVVPLDERRRILERLVQPTVQHGFLGNTPPVGTKPPPVLNLDREDQRARYLPLPPIVLPELALVAVAPPPVVTVLAGTDWAAEISTFL